MRQQSGEGLFRALRLAAGGTELIQLEAGSWGGPAQSKVGGSEQSFFVALLIQQCARWGAGASPFLWGFLSKDN